MCGWCGWRWLCVVGGGGVWLMWLEVVGVVGGGGVWLV